VGLTALGSLIWLHAPLETRILIRLNRRMRGELRLFWRLIEVWPMLIDPGHGPAGQRSSLPRLPGVPRPVQGKRWGRQWTKARLEPNPLAVYARHDTRARGHSYACKRA
jgi:hypothetical protein